jgi:hypothetical protein
MLNPPLSGQIWLALISDPNGKFRKRRPVLIVKSYKNEFGDYGSSVVFGITTKVSGLGQGDEYVLTPSKSNGLIEECAIKFFWLDMVQSHHFEKQLGTLTRDEFQEVMDMAQEFEKKLP